MVCFPDCSKAVNIIYNVVFTDVKLGRGMDTTVCTVKLNGTVCAATQKC